jgi:hypothetical protein
MFGMNFNRAPKPGPSKEALHPAKTDEEALEALREKVDAVIESDPSFSALTPEDTEMVVNALAVMQEKTGTPYTVDMIENPHESEGLPEEIGAVIVERLSAKGHAPTLVTDHQGVAHRAESVSDASHFVEEQRTQES